MSSLLSNHTLTRAHWTPASSQSVIRPETNQNCTDCYNIVSDLLMEKTVVVEPHTYDGSSKYSTRIIVILRKISYVLACFSDSFVKCQPKASLQHHCNHVLVQSTAAEKLLAEGPPCCISTGNTTSASISQSYTQAMQDNDLPWLPPVQSCQTEEHKEEGRGQEDRYQLQQHRINTTQYCAFNFDFPKIRNLVMRLERYPDRTFLPVEIRVRGKAR